MDDDITRRQMLRTGAAIAAGSLSAHLSPGQSSGSSPSSEEPPDHSTEQSQNFNSQFSTYSRYHPSFGGPHDSNEYLGKLVPGLRKSGLPPVPIQTPDVDKLPWKMMNGVKEFEF